MNSLEDKDTVCVRNQIHVNFINSKVTLYAWYKFMAN